MAQCRAPIRTAGEEGTIASITLDVDPVIGSCSHWMILTLIVLNLNPLCTLVIRCYQSGLHQLGFIRVCCTKVCLYLNPFGSSKCYLDAL